MITVATDDLAAAFKAAMRQLVATVTIITTGQNGRPSGMTATAVTSLCADPPSLLACVNRSASIHPSLTMGTRFCINILGNRHHALSLAFGGGTSPEDRFADDRWYIDDHGVPCLYGAPAAIFCTVDRLIDYGTHSIVVGKVYGARSDDALGPLVYGNGSFLDLMVQPTGERS